MSGNRATDHEDDCLSEAGDNIQVHSDCYDSSEHLDCQDDKQDDAWQDVAANGDRQEVYCYCSNS